MQPQQFDYLISQPKTGNVIPQHNTTPAYIDNTPNRAPPAQLQLQSHLPKSPTCLNDAALFIQMIFECFMAHCNHLLCLVCISIDVVHAATVLEAQMEMEYSAIITYKWILHI
jgi:hypothetical protein